MTALHGSLPAGIEILGEEVPGMDRVLTPAAVRFLAALLRNFTDERERLFARRREVQRRLSAGANPEFLEETRSIRQESWMVAPAPADLLDRRVEITGPVERKMMI